jgi:hypothetical protein
MLESGVRDEDQSGNVSSWRFDLQAAPKAASPEAYRGHRIGRLPHPGNDVTLRSIRCVPAGDGHPEAAGPTRKIDPLTIAAGTHVRLVEALDGWDEGRRPTERIV